MLSPYELTPEAKQPDKLLYLLQVCSDQNDYQPIDKNYLPIDMIFKYPAQIRHTNNPQRTSKQIQEVLNKELDALPYSVLITPDKSSDTTYRTTYSFKLINSRIDIDDVSILDI